MVTMMGWQSRTIVIEQQFVGYEFIERDVEFLGNWGNYGCETSRNEKDRDFPLVKDKHKIPEETNEDNSHRLCYIQDNDN